MRFRLAMLLLPVATLILGCADDQAASRQGSTPASAGPINYFPEYTFSQDLSHDEFVREWYSGHLEAMEEPSLHGAADDDDAHVFRFLWLRTWQRPVALRLEIDAEQHGVLHVKVLDGAGGYDPGELVRDEFIPMSYQDVDSILEALDGIGYWNLPTRDGNIGFDGAQWVLEGVEDGRYHLVDRWTPGGEIASVCRVLLIHAGLGEEE